MTASLLVELLTEELPPKALLRLSKAFARGIRDGLDARAFLEGDAEPSVYATPRRLAVWISGVRARQPEQAVERKGPSLAGAFDASGAPTPALAGFARSCGVAPDALDRVGEGKSGYVVHRSRKAGEPLAAHLAEVVQAAVRQLPIPKLMRWGAGDAEFVRPVHGLVMLHGGEVVPGRVLGLESGRSTRGHRFLSHGEIALGHADDYARVLETEGRVVADFGARRDRIRTALARAATGAEILAGPELLDEVTALTEWPVVLEGRFDPAFLEVPAECLTLSMRHHQRYFPLGERPVGRPNSVNSDLATPDLATPGPASPDSATPGPASGGARLLPRFLLVSNLQADDSTQIVRGNERVLRARLSDARFFFEQDRKTRLQDRAAGLAQVVYHNRLGSQWQRVERLEAVARAIAERLGGDGALAARAARLCKADLLTDMVGEFPELQGVMGETYARLDGEPETVARAVREHYLPRGAGDALPEGTIALALALADRLDTLVGIYGIGLIPTGDKDPFGLRRAALGVLRVLIERDLPLELGELLALARDAFPAGLLAADVVGGLQGFIAERLRSYLRERGFAADAVEAVLALAPTRMDEVLPRLEAVRAFKALPEADSLAAANKRIQNILRKAAGSAGEVPDARLFTEDAERELHAALGRAEPEVEALLAGRDYRAALVALAALRPAVDRFFDEVLVMSEDPAVRANRLALLVRLARLMNRVADIARLAADRPAAYGASLPSPGPAP